MINKLIGKILLFCAIFFLIDYLIGSFIERYGLSYNERTVRNIYCVKDKLDILFVGSSHTYSAIDTQVFAKSNLKTMNLGLATAGPIYYIYMIKAFLQNNEKPRKIVIEAAYHTFTNKSDNLSYGYFAYLNMRDRLTYYLEKKDYQSFLNSLSRSFLNRDFFFSAFAVFLGKEESVKWDNGFIYTSGSLDDGQSLAHSLGIYRNYFKDNADHLHDKKFEVFNNMLSFLKKSDIDVVIIDIPEYYLLKDDHTTYQPLRTQFVKKVTNSAGQYGYSFIDFNSEKSCEKLRKDKSLYRTADHMNWQGGKKFSRILMDTLQERFAH